MKNDKKVQRLWIQNSSFSQNAGKREVWGWRTIGRSGSSHTLSRGPVFSLLRHSAHSDGSTALTGKRTDKRRNGSQERAGWRIKKPLVQLSFQHALPLCLLYDTFRDGMEEAAAERDITMHGLGFANSSFPWEGGLDWQNKTTTGNTSSPESGAAVWVCQPLHTENLLL